jgi:polyisoprenoid-binding protein YceI
MLTKTKWVIDSSRSSIFFEVEHYLMPNVKGEFKMFNSKTFSDNFDFKVNETNLWISSSSIKTGDKYCDEQLKSSSFFDVENYKHIFFNGHTIENSQSGNCYYLSGDLTIKGITSRIKLNVEFEGIKKNIFGNEKANFVINGTISRSDFGLNLNSDLEAWQILASDKVKINCKLQLKKSTIQEGEWPLVNISEPQEMVNYF